MTASPTDRLMTGIEPIDYTLGGLPRGYNVLILGKPGTGKTLFSIKMAYHMASSGERVVFVTIPTPKSMFEAQVASMGIDLAELERRGVLKLISLADPSNRVEGESLFVSMLGTIEEHDPSVVIVDDPSILVTRVSVPFLVGTISGELGRETKELGRLLVAAMDEDILRIYREHHAFLLSRADIVLRLENEKQGGRIVRRMVVVKSRGMAPTAHCVDFEVDQAGRIRLAHPSRPGCSEGVRRGLEWERRSPRASQGKVRGVGAEDLAPGADQMA